MRRVKDIHTSISSIMGFTLLGLVWAIANTKWWSCSSDSGQIYQNYIYGALGLLVGTMLTLVARHYGHGEKLKYYTEAAMRLLLLYALVTVALIKTEGQFYDLTLMTQEHKLSDLESSTFASAFYAYSPLFQSFSGAILLLGLGFICFRNTQRIGNLILAAALVNTVVLNHSFDSCFLMKNSIYLAAVGYFLYNDFFELFAFATRTQPAITYDWKPIATHGHLYKSASLYKVVLLAGLLFYNHDFVDDIKNYRGRNKDNPIAGVWKVAKIDYLSQDTSEVTKRELGDFDRIIIDKDRFGAVSVGDSLSYFEFIVDPKYNQLEFWNFLDYRDIDLKGRYQQISEDTLLYIGRNNRDSLQIVLTLDKKHTKESTE